MFFGCSDDSNALTARRCDGMPRLFVAELLKSAPSDDTNELKLVACARLTACARLVQFLDVGFCDSAPRILKSCSPLAFASSYFDLDTLSSLRCALMLLAP